MLVTKTDYKIVQEKKRLSVYLGDKMKAKGFLNRSDALAAIHVIEGKEKGVRFEEYDDTIYKKQTIDSALSA